MLPSYSQEGYIAQRNERISSQVSVTKGLMQLTQRINFTESYKHETQLNIVLIVYTVDGYTHICQQLIYVHTLRACVGMPLMTDQLHGFCRAYILNRLHCYFFSVFVVQTIYITILRM